MQNDSESRSISLERQINEGMVNSELSGKVAIVTGAGRMRGIGRATAVILARMGSNVVVTGTGRNPDTFPHDEKDVGWRDIDSTVEEIQANGVRGLPLVVDVSSEMTSLVGLTLSLIMQRLPMAQIGCPCSI